VRPLRARGYLCTGSLETLRCRKSAHAEPVGPTRPAGTVSQRRDQAIDRAHHHLVLNPLDPSRVNHADHWKRATPTPTPTPVTTAPPVRAPERDADPRTSSFSSQSRTRRRWVRAPASRCRHVPARATSAAATNPRVEEPRALAAPGPRSGRPRRCGMRAPTSGEHRARARAPERGGRQRPRRLPRRRQPAPRGWRQCSPSPPYRLSIAGGTAAGARSSTGVLRDLAHAVIVSPASDGSAASAHTEPTVDGPAPGALIPGLRRARLSLLCAAVRICAIGLLNGTYSSVLTGFCPRQWPSACVPHGAENMLVCRQKHTQRP
jgi:hypothetical protein